MTGWKTYLAAFVGVAIAGAHALGYITADQAQAAAEFAAFCGLAALRQAVAKGPKDAAP